MRTKDTPATRNKKKKYFVEQSCLVIQKLGIANFTVRNVAKEAGKNSASIYNYFRDSEQLLSLAILHIISPYLADLATILKKKEQKSYYQWITMITRYAYFAFQQPEIYNYAFYSAHSQEVFNEHDVYLKIFDSPVFQDPTLNKVVWAGSTHKRDALFFDSLIKEGIVKSNKKKYCLDFFYALVIGMAEQINLQKISDVTGQVEKFMDYYISFLLANSNIEEPKEQLLRSLHKYAIEKEA
jgi:AcrR family transcriptional regulator